MEINLQIINRGNMRAGCLHQAFRYSDRIYGFQCHPEMTATSIQEMLANCPKDLQKEVMAIKKPKVMIGCPL